MNLGKSEPRFRREIGVLTVLILVAFGLRLLRLDFQPLWWDEGYSVWFATQPVAQMLALTAQDIHPPLYYALLHGWTLLLGADPAILRLLSVVVGTLTIPVIYLAARRMLPRRAALLATFLLTINPLHIYYSQEVRMYGLVALLGTGVLAAAWRVFEQGSWGAGEQGSRGAEEVGSKNASAPPHLRTPAPLHLRTSAPLLAYILLTTAALYTQYYAVFLPVGLTLYALWHWRRNGRGLLTWLGAQAAVALLYLPWVLYAGPKLVLYVSQKIVKDADRPLGALAYIGRHLSAFLSGHLEGPLAPWWPAALVLLVPLAVGWVLMMKPGSTGAEEQGSRGEGEKRSDGPSAPPRRRTSALMIATVTLTALALGWLISLRYPFFPARGERLLLLALPPFILLVAAGIDALWRRWRVIGYVTLGLVVATSVASLAAFYAVPRYPDDDYRPLIARTVEQGLPRDTVFAVYPWQIGYWRSYGSPNGPTAVLSPDPAWGPAVSDALDAALARGRVWFPAHLALGAILETQAEAYLATESVPFLNEWYGPDTRLSAWAALPEARPVEAPDVRFLLPGSGAGVVDLAGVAASPGPVPGANAVVPLSLRWRAEAPPPVLDVSLRLTDDLGQIWAQHDYEPLGGLGKGWLLTSADEHGQFSAEDRLGLLIPAGTPPGRYEIELLARPKDSDRPLEAQGADGKSLGTSVPLLAFEVAPADRDLDPARLPIGTRKEVALGDGLRFLGYTADEAPATPGDLRKVNLFWQATDAPAADYIAFLQLLGRDGEAIPLWEAPPGAAYPTTRWMPGTLMRTQASFRVPAALPDGRYRLIAGLFRPSDGARLKTPRGTDYVTLGSVSVRGREHGLNPPEPGHRTDVDFAGVAKTVGYDLDVPEAGLAPGDTLDLTLYWQALASAGRAYTVFVHLLDEAGTVRGYGDGEPGGGRYPTTGWLPGEYLADRHTVTVAPDAPPGTYRLAIGLYDPTTGERLKAPDGADQTLLETPITVRP